MKIIRSPERVYNTFVAQYELNDMLIGQPSFFPGALIAYLIARSDRARLLSFRAVGEAEIGGFPHILLADRIQFDQWFPDVSEFMHQLRDISPTDWELHLVFQETELLVTGELCDIVIGLSWPADREINPIPFLSEIETRTYDYSAFPQELVARFQERFRQSRKGAVKALMKLSDYPDIYHEFVRGMKGEDFAFPKNGGVTESGYSAEALHRSYPLSPLGAYNYLIYLRESPQAALADLKKGLPRK